MPKEIIQSVGRRLMMTAVFCLRDRRIHATKALPTTTTGNKLITMNKKVFQKYMPLSNSINDIIQTMSQATIQAI